MEEHIQYPLDYGYPAHRAKPAPNDQVPDEIGRGPAKSLLNWGAHQVSWTKPAVDVYPNATVYPSSPNTDGVRAFQFRDSEANTWQSDRNHHWYTVSGREIRPAPAFWGEVQLK